MIEVLEESLLHGGQKKGRPMNHDLDWMAGRWTPKEAEAFDRALAGQRTVDPDLWK